MRFVGAASAAAGVAAMTFQGGLGGLGLLDEGFAWLVAAADGAVAAAAFCFLAGGGVAALLLLPAAVVVAVVAVARHFAARGGRHGRRGRRGRRCSSYLGSECLSRLFRAFL